MAIPSNYDSVTMTINPGTLTTAADFAQECGNSIAGALNTIGNTLSGLALGWNGTSAAEAQDFATKWTNAMTQLFGPENDPKTGVMNQLMGGLTEAAGNYSNCESGITSMFAKLSAALSAATASSGSDTDPIPPGTTITDATQTAVTEINWSTTSHAGILPG